MDHDEIGKASQELWQRMAAGWSTRRDHMWDNSKPVGEWLVRKLDPRAGQTVLELAAGMGDTGLLAARALGDRGRLISTDFASSMVEGAERRARELGIENAEFRVMDAQKMDLETDSVDGVLCRFGLMLMSDPSAALTETRRVLRAGGRLCLAVFSTPDKNPWAEVSPRALIAAGLMDAPPPGGPGVFALSDPRQLRNLLAEAGFPDSSIEEVPITWRHDDFDQYWTFLNDVAGGTATLIASLDDRQKIVARDALRAAVRDYQDGEEIALPGVALTAVAR